MTFKGYDGPIYDKGGECELVTENRDGSAWVIGSDRVKRLFDARGIQVAKHIPDEDRRVLMSEPYKSARKTLALLALIGGGFTVLVWCLVAMARAS